MRQEFMFGRIAVLDEVCTAIPGGAAARNVLLWGARLFARPYQQIVILNIYCKNHYPLRFLAFGLYQLFLIVLLIFGTLY